MEKLLSMFKGVTFPQVALVAVLAGLFVLTKKYLPNTDVEEIATFIAMVIFGLAAREKKSDGASVLILCFGLAGLSGCALFRNMPAPDLMDAKNAGELFYCVYQHRNESHTTILRRCGDESAQFLVDLVSMAKAAEKTGWQPTLPMRDAGVDAEAGAQ
jgi:hypothetical protein